MSNDNSHCRSCGKSIQWAVSFKGKNIPIDVEPSPEGNIELIPQGQWKPQLAVYHYLKPKDQMLYLSHFATCPAADGHHKKELTKMSREKS